MENRINLPLHRCIDRQIYMTNHQASTRHEKSISSSVSNGQHILVNEQILSIPKATLPLVIFNSHWFLACCSTVADFTIFFSAGTVCNKESVSNFPVKNAFRAFFISRLLQIRGYSHVSARILITQLCLPKKLWSVSAAEQLLQPKALIWLLVGRSTFGDVCRYCWLHRLWHTLLHRVLPRLDRRFKILATRENFFLAG